MTPKGMKGVLVGGDAEGNTVGGTLLRLRSTGVERRYNERVLVSRERERHRDTGVVSEFYIRKYAAGT